MSLHANCDANEADEVPEILGPDNSKLAKFDILPSSVDHVHETPSMEESMEKLGPNNPHRTGEMLAENLPAIG
jgi:hypothetical protein